MKARCFATLTLLLCVMLLPFQSVEASPCPPCPEGYGFAGLNSEVHSTADIVGSSATISFHSVGLCNEDVYDPSEPQSFPYNHITVWTMVVGHNPNVSSDPYNVYIQTGWMRYNGLDHGGRNRVFMQAGRIVNGQYINDTFYNDNQYLSGSGEYTIELADSSEGRWEAYYDTQSAPWKSYAFSYWENIIGKQARNKGEVSRLKSDMPGTASSRCVLKRLQYLLEGDSEYISQNTRNNSTTTHGSKFGHQKVSETEVRIWDKQDDCP